MACSSPCPATLTKASAARALSLGSESSSHALAAATARSLPATFTSAPAAASRTSSSLSPRRELRAAMDSSWLLSATSPSTSTAVCLTCGLTSFMQAQTVARAMACRSFATLPTASTAAHRTRGSGCSRKVPIEAMMCSSLPSASCPRTSAAAFWTSPSLSPRQEHTEVTIAAVPLKGYSSKPVSDASRTWDSWLCRFRWSLSSETTTVTDRAPSPSWT
mmetsp:Transcript_65601/g.211649  ORF Transcript_65601/g.211649 Transcript_65601/m.211649 type:complete len:219 (-) Transcript_65601:238-894(-)